MKLTVLLKKVIICSVVIGFQSACAQSNIHGSIVDRVGKPLSNANVLLLKAADSSLVKGSITNEGGKYSFIDISGGRFIISATHTGFEQA